MELLKENRQSNLLDISLTNIFINLSPEARKTKAKINYRDYIKNKKHLHSKRHHQQNRRQPTECKKISANDRSDKGLISKYIKNVYIPQHQKQRIQ